MPQTTIHLFRLANGRVPVQEWIELLDRREPDAFQKCLARIMRLERLGFELRRPFVDYLRDDIFELRWRVVRVQYRILYFFSGGRNSVVLSDGLTKEGKVTDVDIDRAIRNRRLVAQNPGQHLAEWEG